MEKPQVSVIIPVYQVENYLERAVDSVLGQTLENIEIILVDDGSEDLSGQICDMYAEKYPEKVKVIHKENDGLGMARNTGIEAASGEYIAFLDSDDTAEPQMYEEMYEKALSGNYDMVMCDVRIIYVDENRETVSEIVKAVLSMSKDNVGALIVITTQSVPQHILETGTELGAKVSQPLLECVFNTGADLHDGAVFIHGDKILAAGCFLPLSQNQSLPKELGTRHRAALGLSEQYNVLTIVVSEETGVISVACDGRLERYYDAEMLTDIIEQTYGLKANRTAKKKWRMKKRGDGNE